MSDRERQDRSNDRADSAQRRHERLCAYLFGELDEEGRRDVERLLAESPELRAEKQRLEATIALVRGALPPEEALPDEARRRLTAAAAGATVPGQVRPWPRRLAGRPLAAAAAVLALILGGLGVRALVGSGARPATGNEVARLDAAADPRAKAPAETAPSTAGRAAGQLRSLGYAGERDGMPPGPTGGGEPPVDELGRLRAAAKAVPPQRGGGTDPVSDADEPMEEDTEGWEKENVIGIGGGSDPGVEVLEEEESELDWAGRLASQAEHHDDDLFLGEEGVEAFGLPSLESSEGKKAQVGKVEVVGARPSLPSEAQGVRRLRLDYPNSPSVLVPESSALLPAGRQAVARERRSGGEDAWILPGFLTDNPFDSDAFDDLRPAAGELLQLRGRLTGKSALDVEAYCDRIVRFCRIRPSETPSMMFFRCWGDNPFELTRLDALSTFAADVDTASYALARSYLNQGYMPTKAQIRTEEFVNYFDSGVPAPRRQTFGIHLEMAPSLFGGPDRWMLRVVVRGKEIDRLERQNLTLTFVVDVSGSMKQGNRIELVKHSMRLLVGELFPNDAIAIVAFSNEARLVLPMTSASRKGLIESAIFGLQANGGTNAEAGLRMGYELAAQGLTPGANNRVVLLSDGVANIGETDQKELLAGVKGHRAKGIYLNTIGVGLGNHNDALLEQLADGGDGICNYIDTQEEAYRALIENFTGAFQPIARDVKIQVELDPAQVASYRLLGYENRAVADADFRNDRIDAGEVGSGHQVTALYELDGVTPGDGPLATARVRWKDLFPIDRGEAGGDVEGGDGAREIEKTIVFRQVATEFRGTTPGYQRAVLVAQLAEFLRRSVHARGDSFATLVAESQRLERELGDPDFSAFRKLVGDKADFIRSHLPSDDVLTRSIEELCRNHYLRGQLEKLRQDEEDRELLEELERQNRELEARIRELLKKELGEDSGQGR